MLFVIAEDGCETIASFLRSGVAALTGYCVGTVDVGLAFEVLWLKEYLHEDQ
jgi:hypothetical protein